MSSFGPRFPVPIPNRGADTQTDGDQKGRSHQDGSVYGTHAGMHTPSSEKPVKGQPLTDLYVWEEA